MIHGSRGGDEDPVVPARMLISDIKYQKIIVNQGPRENIAMSQWSFSMHKI